MIRKLTFAFLASLLLACEQESTEKLREDSKGWEMVADLERLNKALETQNQLLKTNLEENKRGIRLRDSMIRTLESTDRLKEVRLALYEKQTTLQSTALGICRGEQKRLADQVWVYQKWIDNHTPQKFFIVDSTFTDSGL